MPCVIPVASSNRNNALRNRSKKRGERTEPCTVPVSSCMGAEHPVSTLIFIQDLLYFVACWPTFVVMFHYFSRSPVATSCPWAGPAWSSLFLGLHDSGRHESAI
jgi:hypothetical protein